MKRSMLCCFLTVFIFCACASLGLVSTKQKETDLVENGYKALSLGDYVTAEHLLKQALLINEKNPVARLNLGIIYQTTDRYEEARQIYKSVIDLKPSQTATETTVQGYTGKNLADIARIKLDSLPPAAVGIPQVKNENDADGDGVPDDIDQCDNTPPTAKVFDNGCWMLIGLFQSGETDVVDGATKQLDEVATVLMQNPSLRIEIQGYTDNSGAADYNKLLSEKRAQSVMRYLVQQGVAAERLRSVGFGQNRPIASNRTADGRAQNRRVEFHLIPF